MEGKTIKAAVLEAFRKPVTIREMPDPELKKDGVILRVKAAGICRSDWHVWTGDWEWNHFKVKLPHILGHEFCGIVEVVGEEVRRFKPGDRVIVPFTQGCGICPECQSGHENVCDHLAMPGFSYWGGFSELVHIPRADLNLMPLPDDIPFIHAAALGCRYMTAFHGLVDQIQLKPGEWIAVHGCGGVGLAVIQVARALGAQPVAVDIAEDKLALAKKLGAVHTINASEHPAHRVIRSLTGGGSHVSVDALGIRSTCQSAIKSLRKRGRHLQIGLTTRDDQGQIPVPIDAIVQKEIEMKGTFGMPAWRYPDLLQMVRFGKINPGDLVTRTIALRDVGRALQEMDSYSGVGVTVIDQWD